MQSCEYAGDPITERRSHPWTHAVDDARCRYYDLTATPLHIRTSLEDFLPWHGYPAIEDFYTLLEQLNQPASALESSDCAFTGPHANDQASIPCALQCTGRVIILFRALHKNTVPAHIERLKNELLIALTQLDPDFQRGVIGTTLIPTRYLTLPQRKNQQLGSQLMISFWAWGDTVADTMTNLRRLFGNLARALQSLTA